MHQYSIKTASSVQAVHTAGESKWWGKRLKCAPADPRQRTHTATSVSIFYQFRDQRREKNVLASNLMTNSFTLEW